MAAIKNPTVITKHVKKELLRIKHGSGGVSNAAVRMAESDKAVNLFKKYRNARQVAQAIIVLANNGWDATETNT